MPLVRKHSQSAKNQAIRILYTGGNIMQIRMMISGILLVMLWFVQGYSQFIVREGTVDYLKVEQATGNVGIGLGTGSPQARLDVAGSIRFRGLGTTITNPVITVDVDGNLGVAQDQQGSGADGVVDGISISTGPSKTVTLSRSIGGDLTETFTDMVEDADADPNNERQRLQYDAGTGRLTIGNGGQSSGNYITLTDNVEDHQDLDEVLSDGNNAQGREALNFGGIAVGGSVLNGKLTVSGTKDNYSNPGWQGDPSVNAQSAVHGEITGAVSASGLNEVYTMFSKIDRQPQLSFTSAQMGTMINPDNNKVLAYGSLGTEHGNVLAGVKSEIQADHVKSLDSPPNIIAGVYSNVRDNSTLFGENVYAGYFTGGVTYFNESIGVGKEPVNGHVIDCWGGAYTNGIKWFEGSSREYKTDIQILESNLAYDILKELEPVTFRYKSGPDQRTTVGFIAEEVPELMAAADRKGVSAMTFVGILTRVVQQQQNQLAQQDAHIRELKEAIKNLSY
jgi:hypothetical protein